MSEAIDMNRPLLDEDCLSRAHPWSILELSLPNAQLAGVLAGFMVLAITTLLLLKGNLPSRTVSHTLGLFAAGVLVLGIDSYLFGSVTATRTPAGADPRQYCEAAWIQLMPAAGMLALGASLLVAGIGWMLTHHTIDDIEPNKQLTTLGNVLTGMVLGGTTALLIYTSWVFIELMAGEFRIEEDPPMKASKVAAQVAVGLFGAIIIGRVAWIITQKAWGLSHNVETEQDWEQVRNPRYKSVEKAAWLSGVYVMVAIGATIVLPNWHYIFSPDHVQITQLYKLWWSISLCLFAPGVIFLFIACSMPGPYSQWEIKARERAMRKKGYEKVEVKEVKQGDTIVGSASRRIYSVAKVEEHPDHCRTLTLSRLPLGKHTHRTTAGDIERTYPHKDKVWRPKPSTNQTDADDSTSPETEKTTG